jgi:DNA-binding response OmpR family regulator
VLLISETEVTREQLRLYLEDAGYRVIAMGRAEDVAGTLTAARADVLVFEPASDRVDPGECLDRLRQVEALRGAPVVLVADQGRMLARGADAVVGKPVRRTELLTQVENVLSEARSATGPT